MDENIKESIIYVGNIDESIQYEDLYNLFVTFGVIKNIDMPLDHQTQKHKGFAFIEYEEPDDCLHAIDNYDNAEVYGKIIKVKKSRAYRGKLNKAIWEQESWHKANMERVAQENAEKIKEAS